MRIGLSGLKGAGKDTVGAELISRYGFTRLAFAASLKESAAAALGIDAARFEQDKNSDSSMITYWGRGNYSKTISVREYLQRYGTEAHREVFGESFWTDQLLNNLPPEPSLIVVTDCRFRNETAGLKALGGLIVNVQRPGTEVGDVHGSEEQHPDLWDYVLENNGSLEDIPALVDAMLLDLSLPVPTGV